MPYSPTSRAEQRPAEAKPRFATYQLPFGLSRTLQLLDSTCGLGIWRRRGRNHQAETLQEQDRALGRATPHELAALALTILNVNVPT
jgi:hypothetical protein